MNDILKLPMASFSRPMAHLYSVFASVCRLANCLRSLSSESLAQLERSDESRDVKLDPDRGMSFRKSQRIQIEASRARIEVSGAAVVSKVVLWSFSTSAP